MLEDLLAMGVAFNAQQFEQFNEAFQQVPVNYPIPFRQDFDRLLASDMPEYAAAVVARVSVLTTFAMDRGTAMDESYRSVLDIQCVNPESFADRAWNITVQNTLVAKLVFKTLPIADDDHLRVVVYDNVDHGAIYLRRLVDEFWESNHHVMLNEVGIHQLMFAELIPSLGMDMRRVHRRPRNPFLNSELTYFFENEITTGRLHEIQLTFPDLPES